MNKNRLATTFKMVDGLELIKKERARLEEIVTRKDFSTKQHCQWMLEWLKQTDEQHLLKLMDSSKDTIDNNYCCHICFTPKRYLLSTSFSFCDEYDCGMNICRECAIKIGELVKKLPKEDE